MFFVTRVFPGGSERAPINPDNVCFCRKALGQNADEGSGAKGVVRFVCGAEWLIAETSTTFYDLWETSK